MDLISWILEAILNGQPNTLDEPEAGPHAVPIG